MPQKVVIERFLNSSSERCPKKCDVLRHLSLNKRGGYPKHITVLGHEREGDVETV